MAGRTWERLAGLAGLVFFGLIVATFFTPSTPDIGVADSAIGPAVAGEWKGLAGGVYVLGAAAASLVVFASGLWSRLRRAEGEVAGASAVALAGAVMLATLMLVSAGVSLTLASAAREGRDAAALRALFELDNTLFVASGFAFALFLLGAAISTIATRALPAWLGWVAAILCAGFLVGSLGVLSGDAEGGVLGIVFWITLMASVVWVLLSAIALLRDPHPAAAPWRQARAGVA